MQDLIEKLESLFAAGDLGRAADVVRTYETTDPARFQLGLAALAVYQKDVAATSRHAERALELAPDEPMVRQYMAMASVLRGDYATAERHAQAAVAHGGGLRSLGWLGNIQLGSGDASGAEATFRKILAIDPGNLTALNGLGTARFRQRDLDEAVMTFARAFALDPVDPTAIRNLLDVYGNAGRMLGAIAMVTLTRNRYPDPTAAVAFDLMVLQALASWHRGFPPKGATSDADDAVAAVLRDSAQSPVPVRLGVARALLDCQRFAEAKAILHEVEAQVASPTNRGNAEYVRGVLAEQANDKPGAITAYEAALAADPQRWDACCNAVTLLVERDDPKSLERAGELLAKMSPELKSSRPQLLFNEAVYLMRIGQIAEARAAAERVVSAAGNTAVGELARVLLEETADGD